MITCLRGAVYYAESFYLLTYLILTTSLWVRSFGEEDTEVEKNLGDLPKESWLGFEPRAL